jgi:hypothetical protein
MTASNGHIADVFEGIVEIANDRGVKVGGEWRNVSLFHPVDLSDRGARVRLEIEQGLHSFSSDSGGAGQQRRVDHDHARSRDPAHGCQKAAANFLGLMSQAREEVKSDHMILLADRWLA